MAPPGQSDPTMRAFMSIIKRGGRPEVKKAESVGCRCNCSRGTLVVNCQGCGGGQDLSDPDCLRKVLSAMATEPSSIDAVVLSDHWEVRYDQGCAAVLNGLAEVIRFLKGIGPEQRFEECRDCTSNPRTIADRAASTIPLISPELKEGCSIPPGPHGRTCEQCVWSTEANLLHARSLLATAHGTVNRSAYKVVSGDVR